MFSSQFLHFALFTVFSLFICFVWPRWKQDNWLTAGQTHIWRYNMTLWLNLCLPVAHSQQTKLAHNLSHMAAHTYTHTHTACVWIEKNFAVKSCRMFYSESDERQRRGSRLDVVSIWIWWQLQNTSERFHLFKKRNTCTGSGRMKWPFGKLGSGFCRKLKKLVSTYKSFSDFRK